MNPEQVVRFLLCTGLPLACPVVVCGLFTQGFSLVISHEIGLVTVDERGFVWELFNFRVLHSQIKTRVTRESIRVDKKEFV